MTSLPAIAVHFLILTQVTGWALSVELDMAYSAFDDQYEGCTNEMEEKSPQLLKDELEVNANLKADWKRAETKWKQIKSSIPSSEKLSDYHGTALAAYTQNKSSLEFNKAVREYRQNPHNFPFKAFHYYLTRALQLLSTGECHTVYRGMTTSFTYSGEGNVRFGQFASSSFSKDRAKKQYKPGGVLFTINTCLGVPISAFSFKPEEKEVLIPGYEMYQQIDVSSEKHEEVLLARPQKFKSNYNCVYIHSLNGSGTRESPVFLLLLLLPCLLGQLLLPAEL